MDAKHCSGCDQDRYNHPGMCERPGIDAPVTSKACWNLKDAKLVTRYRQGWWDTPPRGGGPALAKVKVPSCYSQSGRAVFTKDKEGA